MSVSKNTQKAIWGPPLKFCGDCKYFIVYEGGDRTGEGACGTVGDYSSPDDEACGDWEAKGKRK